MKMSDLAKLAGVSKSTVSRALADSPRVTLETRERIKKLAEQHNYRLNTRARNFRLKNTLTIGVLLPSSGREDWLASDPFVLEMLGSVADALESRGGHELLLAKHSGYDPSWLEEFAMNRSVDGIIVIGQSLYHEQLKRIAKLNPAVVVWGAQLEDQNYLTVGSDNYLGGQLATQHLLEQGRRNFLFLGDTRYPETQQRYKGYRDVIEAAGLQCRSEVITESENNNNAELAHLEATLRNGAPFDALVASTDMLAISAIKVITRQGLSVPNDVAVVGYDNITLADYSSPTLSTITQDRMSGGALLVDKLFELIDQGHAENVVVETKLIRRESS